MIGKEYAKSVIKNYTYSNEYSNIYDFFEATKITKVCFNTCLKVIKEENTYLYQQCLLKIKKSKIDNYYRCLDKCRDLAKGIQTGFFSDDTPFDMLEFYKRLPFASELGRRDFSDCREVNPAIMDSKFIFGRIDKFTEIADTIINKIIMDFVRYKKISRIRIIKEEDLRNKYQGITRFYKRANDSKGNELIIDRELTIDTIDKVINYMKVNNLLFLEPIFILVLERYFIGEIKLGEEKPHKLVRNKK